MGKKGIARVGDPINHGGTVITGALTALCDGRPIACVGDKVVCALHGPQIILPDTNTTRLINGKPIAHIGSKTSCGATIISGSLTSTIEV